MSLLDRLRQALGARPGATAPIRLPGFQHMPELADLPRGSAAEQAVADICQEAIATSRNYSIKLSGSDRYQRLKHEPAAFQIEIIAAALGDPCRGSRTYGGTAFQIVQARKQIVSQLLRRNLPLGDALLGHLVASWLAEKYSLEYSDLPGLSILGAVERHAVTAPLSPALRAQLERLHQRVAGHPGHAGGNKWCFTVADRVARLLDPQTAAAKPAFPAGEFGESLANWLAARPEESRDGWRDLALLAAKAGDKAKPTAKWKAQAAGLLATIGMAEFTAGLAELLRQTTPDPNRLDPSLDILKGFVWAAPLIGAGELAGAVGRFAERCFGKVRGVGARSVKLGNAALHALSEMAGEPQAGAELFRLKTLIKYPSARKVIEQRIEELAARAGQSVDDLEDKALPDYGLSPGGTLRETFGEATAELHLTATATAVAWTGAGGKPVKAPPAGVKLDYKEELAAFQLHAKDIERARAAQALRLEQGWLEQRTWRLGDWRASFLAHPLRRPLTEALIWRVEEDGRHVSVLPAQGRLLDCAGDEACFADDARVSLWHPLDGTPEEVLAWRARIVEVGLTQPIKQAHREIYVLTDAERQTETYSNRFAAHILRQHQFRALCLARGWQYDFMGGWDSWNEPTRHLPRLGLRVTYQVDPIEDGQRSEAYVPLHIATDQVRFIRDGGREPIPLTEVAPVVFSELLRDVDLFVAVTSVANDPRWTDGGPDGRFGGYWQSWAFGELGQSAETRRELIAQIAPRLSIADRLEIGDKALIVTGKRQKYAIHFGSTNIQILPANRYLCIVPDGTAREADKVRLPFTGDTQLSTILAKAFMLVDESKITDLTILRQL
jgi:hypothetical protein